MPDEIPVHLFLFGQTGDVVFHEQLVEEHAVENVELGPGHGAVADFVHRGAVTGAPFVGELTPVNLEVFLFAPHRALANDGAAPVDDGAESVKDEGFYAKWIRGSRIYARGVRRQRR